MSEDNGKRAREAESGSGSGSDDEQPTKKTRSVVLPFWNGAKARTALECLRVQVKKAMSEIDDILTQGIPTDISYSKVEASTREGNITRSKITRHLQELIYEITCMSPSVPDHGARDCDTMLEAATQILFEASAAMSYELKIDTGHLRLETLESLRKLEKDESTPRHPKVSKLAEELRADMEKGFRHAMYASYAENLNTVLSMYTLVLTKLVHIPALVDKLEYASRVAHRK